MRLEDEFIFNPDLINLDVILESYKLNYNWHLDIIEDKLSQETFDAYLLEDKLKSVIYEYNTEELITKCMISFDLCEKIRDNIYMEDSFFLDIFENNKNIQTITV